MNAFAEISQGSCTAPKNIAAKIIMIWLCQDNSWFPPAKLNKTIRLKALKGSLSGTI